VNHCTLLCAIKKLVQFGLGEAQWCRFKDFLEIGAAVIAKILDKSNFLVIVGNTSCKGALWILFLKYWSMIGLFFVTRPIISTSKKSFRSSYAT
jgi:hypothetical protein